MITDEEMDDLPSDMEARFVAVERILRKAVELKQSLARNNEYDPDPDRLEYMTRTAAAARACEIQALADLKLPPVSRNNIWEEYSEFKNTVDYVTMQIRLNAASVNRKGSVGLDAEAKTKIHFFIERIREEIENSDLDADKKDALFKSLNNFSIEVDRARTRAQMLGILWMAFCTRTGAGFEKLKPVRDMLDSISRVMGNAKDLENSVMDSIAGTGNRKRLEPPPKQITGPPASPIDDEIPF